LPANSNYKNIPVVLIYNINPEWTKKEKEEVVKLSEELKDALAEESHPVELLALEDDNIELLLTPFNPLECIVFNWCESMPGADHSEWLVAKKLEEMGFTFTGAASKALALAQDKYRVKKILDETTVPSPAWEIVHSPRVNNWGKYPAIVKPVNEHCSEGISSDSVALNHEELKIIIREIVERYRQTVLVEDFIDGREFHVTLWGNEEIEMLPVAEMDFSFFPCVKDRLCTYESKFVAGTKHYEKIKTLLPAPLSEDEKVSLEKVCKDAYLATGCRDYARFDVRLRDGIFYVLDVNPNADISADASMACAAQIAGLSYGQMASRIVRLAAKRHPVWAAKVKDNT